MTDTNESFSLVDNMEEDSYVNVKENPTDALTLKLIPKHDVIGIDSEESKTMICANLKASELPDDGERRAPVDIIVALDRSGSMMGKKLDLCKQTLELLLQQMMPSDRFGLVSYNSNANIECSIKKMTSQNKEDALRKIRSLYASGNTNISSAISLSFQELQAVENPNSVRAIFLLTDGHANTGVVDLTSLIKLTKNNQQNGYDRMEQKQTQFFGSMFSKHSTEENEWEEDTAKKVESPISLFCFGYGNDHNSHLLRDLAKATETGSYYYVHDDTDVGSSFGDALGGIMSAVAQSVVLTIQIHPDAPIGVEIKEVFHDGAKKRENGTYAVNIGDFYAEETRDILFNIVLSPKSDGKAPPSSSVIPHVSVSVSYMDTAVAQIKPRQLDPVSCSIARPGGTFISEENVHVATQWLRVSVAREMALADQLAQSYRFAEAQKVMHSSKYRLKHCIASIQDDALHAQLVEDVDEMEAGFSSAKKYNQFGAHFAAQQLPSYFGQRCCEGTAMRASNVFRTGGHRSMKAKMAQKNESYRYKEINN